MRGEGAPEKKINKKRCGLPTGTALKIGVRNFRKHPVRTAVTALLAVVAFSFYGVSAALASYEPVRPTTEALAAYGQRGAAIYRREYYYPENQTGGEIDKFLGDDDRSERDVVMTREDEETFEENTGLKMYLTYYLHFGTGAIVTMEDELEAIQEQSDRCFFYYCDGYITMSEEDCAAQGWTIAGRLPKGAEEVALNDCYLYVLSVMGMITEGGKSVEVASASDVIGQRITVGGEGYKTITDVVFTGCDKACGEAEAERSLHHKMFVDYAYYDEYNDTLNGLFSYGLFSFSGERADYERVVRFVTGSDTGDWRYGLSAEGTLGIGAANYIAPLFKNLCLYLSLLFLFFAALLLLNFVSASVRGQLKQVGTLASLGAGKRDLFLIYGLTAAILFAAVGILSCIVTGICIPFVDRYLAHHMTVKVRLLYPDVGVFAGLILLSAAGAALGGLLSVLLTARMSPAEIIRRGQQK